LEATDKSVLLTEDFLADEAREAQEVAETVPQADAARRRFDRQMGLLHALPEGWTVVRDDYTVAFRKAGHYFTVYDADRSQVAQARRVSAREPGRLKQAVHWGGVGGASAGSAWAQGIALMFAAIDAEAHLPAEAREVTD
jgi:hypothetical protein